MPTLVSIIPLLEVLLLSISIVACFDSIWRTTGLFRSALYAVLCSLVFTLASILAQYLTDPKLAIRATLLLVLQLCATVAIAIALFLFYKLITKHSS